MTSCVSPVAVFLMERWAFATREPAADVTVPDRVPSPTCAETWIDARAPITKTRNVRKEAAFPIAVDGRSCRIAFAMDSNCLWHHFIDQYFSVFNGCFLRFGNGRSQNDVFRDNRVKPLQFRNQERGLCNCAGWNCSERFVVIQVNLFKNLHTPGCPSEVHALACWVILHFVNSAFAVQHLNNLSIVRIHHHHLARFIKVSGFHPASDKKAMMHRIQSQSMGHWPSRNRPASDNRAFSTVNNGYLTRSPKNHIQSWRRR